MWGVDNFVAAKNTQGQYGSTGFNEKRASAWNVNSWKQAATLPPRILLHTQEVTGSSRALLEPEMDSEPCGRAVLGAVNKREDFFSTRGCQKSWGKSGPSPAHRSCQSVLSWLRARQRGCYQAATTCHRNRPTARRSRIDDQQLSCCKY